MTKRQHVRFWMLLGVVAAIGIVLFLNDIPVDPWVGALFTCLGVWVLYQTVRAWRSNRARLLVAQSATTAVGLFLIVADLIWPGRHLSIVAMGFICWPAVLNLWARRSTTPSGSWLW